MTQDLELASFKASVDDGTAIDRHVQDRRGTTLIESPL